MCRRQLQPAMLTKKQKILTTSNAVAAVAAAAPAAVAMRSNMDT